MGKLTVKQANELLNSGVITGETLTTLQKTGIVSTRTKRAERYIMSDKGNWVIPVIYFRGLNGGGYSAEMTELKGKINELIDTYTITKDEIVKAENVNKKNNKGKNTK
jgi:hypothetical protein|tara:strand:+ start:85 stop:408 length:324 start_codon:yes stop_codon:yes gene_type:complete